MKDIFYFLNQIAEPNKSGCEKFYEDYKERIELAPGSFIKHQSWEGGYLDHVVEILTIAEQLYDALSTIRPLPFILSDAYVALLWHDAEKIFKYTEPKQFFKRDSEKMTFTLGLMRDYGIGIAEEIKNAILYVHGEGDMYNSFENIQKPIAAFVHTCDTISARIWPEYPKK